MKKPGNNHKYASVLFVAIPIFLALILLVISRPILRIFVDSTYESQPPKIVDIDNPNEVYIITLDSDKSTGLYVMYPINPSDSVTTTSEKHPAYISASSIPVKNYLNQRVKVTGKIVWTYDLMKVSDHPQTKNITQSAAVEINSIQRL